MSRSAVKVVDVGYHSHAKSATSLKFVGLAVGFSQNINCNNVGDILDAEVTHSDKIAKNCRDIARGDV